MRTNKSSSEPTFHPFPSVALYYLRTFPILLNTLFLELLKASYEAPFQPVRPEMMCSTRPLFHYYPIHPSGNDPVPLHPCRTGYRNLLSYDPSPVISPGSLPPACHLKQLPPGSETMVFNLTCDLCPPSRTVNRCSLSNCFCYGSVGSDFLTTRTSLDPITGISIFVS